ncbi:MAG: SGNH/GDSL hydrolase family protein [Gammaproteobacteria bacterium]|nr:SGNH/GDSL hydrolase family protein [Gammaproteobacteria bacterium]
MKYSTFKFYLTQLCLIVLIFPLFARADSPPTFNKIVIFGDSLTDNGNLFLHDAGILPKSPPYFNGRFSNGDVWTDSLDLYFQAKRHIVSENYALGGETVIYHSPIEGFVPYTLSASVQGYLFSAYFQDKSHVLYIIWIGANDYVEGATDLDQLSTNVVNQISDTIQHLIDLGAENFLVINLPDVAATPYGRIQEKREVLATLTRLHNKKLSSAILKFQRDHKNLIIHEFDMNHFFVELMEKPDTYNKQFNVNITDTQSSCWNGGYTLHALAIRPEEVNIPFANGRVDFDRDQLAALISKVPDLAVVYRAMESYSLGLIACENPDEFVFWDHVHPTRVVHKIISNLIIDYINQYYHAQ